MNTLDLLIAALSVATLVGGFRLGLVRRVVVWVGLATGLVVASWILPRVLDGATVGSPARFLIAAAVLIGCGVAGQILGAVVGGRIRRIAHLGGLGPIDAVGGAVIGVVGLLLALWVVLPTMADVRGWPARQARGSRVAATINDLLGSPPSVFDGLPKSLGIKGLPEVFDQFRLAPPDVRVPTASPVPAPVVRAVARSVVKVQGPACDRLLSGSGFVAGSNLVVTNAHVVAGTKSLTVTTSDGERHSGVVVIFDPRRDLALVRVRDIGRPALELSDVAEQAEGVVLGYPRGGDLTVEPFAVAQRVDAQGRDIYEQESVVRRILIVGSTIEPGDSGGPLVDGAGAVVGVAFAVAPDRENVAYAIRVEEIRRLLASIPTDAADTGECL